LDKQTLLDLSVMVLAYLNCFRDLITQF